MLSDIIKAVFGGQPWNAARAPSSAPLFVAPEELLHRLRRVAAERGTLMAAVIREALEKEAASHRPKSKSLGIGASGLRHFTPNRGRGLRVAAVALILDTGPLYAALDRTDASTGSRAIWSTQLQTTRGSLETTTRLVPKRTPMLADTGRRCFWVGSDPLMIAYHDDEWGTLCHDERKLFELLMLGVN
jgi:hypothetical protein